MFRFKWFLEVLDPEYDAAAVLGNRVTTKRDIFIL
jgi:hypothetical protein